MAHSPSGKLNILITNDDGIEAPGIKALIDALADMGDIYVVAPFSERSGASQALTLTHPFEAISLGERTMALKANPADCVLFALRYFRDVPFTWVVSGVNRGPNLGDDTMYSGTVGAAMTGAVNGLYGLALSMGDFGEPMHYASAARVARLLMEQRQTFAGLQGRVLNVNVPNIPYADIRGMRITELSRRYYDPSLHVEKDYLGQTQCWYGKGHVGHDGNPLSDCTAIENHCVSISVLQPSYYDAQGGDLLRSLDWQRMMAIEPSHQA